MNVAQLINHLSRFSADAPVVLAMEDEPQGDYEVASVDCRAMKHDTSYDSIGLRVFHDVNCGLRNTEPEQDVVFLDFESRPGEIVDVTTPVER